jgi:membrane protein DedA with SNARE-associated domain
MSKTSNTTQDNKIKDQRIIIAVALGASFLFAFLYLYLRLNNIIPGPDKAVDWLRNLYSIHGYWVVFFSAMLEGLVIANFYIPGSTAILLGVIFAKSSGLSVPLTIVLVMLGFFISLTADYFIGRKGIQKLLEKFGFTDEVAKQSRNMAERSSWSLFASYIHPNMATLIATGAGIINMPLRKFLALNFIGLLFWDTLWGFAAYYFGDVVLSVIEGPYAALAASGWVALAILVPYYQATRKNA